MPWRTWQATPRPYRSHTWVSRCHGRLGVRFPVGSGCQFTPACILTGGRFTKASALVHPSNTTGKFKAPVGRARSHDTNPAGQASPSSSLPAASRTSVGASEAGGCPHCYTCYSDGSLPHRPPSRSKGLPHPWKRKRKKICCHWVLPSA